MKTQWVGPGDYQTERGQRESSVENDFSISETRNSELPLDHMLQVLLEEAEKQSLLSLKANFFTKPLVKASCALVL